MLPKKLTDILKKQHYKLVGNHSAVQVCRWTKKSLRDEGGCYKQRFYGIESHLCCQMSPSAVFCQNKCEHCWRAIELTAGTDMKSVKEIDNPKEIIKGCIEGQRKMLTGFKGNPKINMKKFKQAQEPMQFAISLVGEPTLYPKLGEMISELRNQGKTSFVVTNGLQPAVLSKLSKESNLPTQLYISLNCPNKKMYSAWHKSSVKNAWEKFNETLKLFENLKRKTRTVIRMTLVKDLNMKPEHVEEYIKLIKKAKPDFLEIKGFMSVGFSRKRIGYESMPRHELVRDYAERIAIGLNEVGEKYKVLDEHELSAVVLLGKDEKRMKIRKNQV